MRNTATLKLGIIVAVASAVCALGCAHTVSSESTHITQESWKAGLDDCREVRLSLKRVIAKDAGEPERTYDQLVLEVRPRPGLEFESLLKSVELRPGDRRGKIDLEEVEVRADEQRRRVWFVDRTTRRIVATLDRDTGVTTGPDDDPPVWAEPNAGILLEEAE